MSIQTRRHHRARLIRKYARDLIAFSGHYSDSAADIKLRATRMATTATVCSCSGCGNQRNAWLVPNPTIQERKQWAAYRDQLKDLE